MKIKETICTEIDERGRVTKRTRTVDIDDSYQDRRADYGVLYGGSPELYHTSMNHIMEAYMDYRRSQQW